MLHLGNILMVVTVLTPRAIGRYTAIAAPILQLPGFVLIVAAVRIQMVRILVTTYDFWFLTISNAILCACLAVLLGDVRILSVVFGCLIVQVSICADAQVGNPRQLLVSSVTNTGVHTILLFAVLFQVVDTSSSQMQGLFRDAHGAHTMSTRDVLMNTQLSMIVMFAKLVYRNWRIVRERVREGRRVTIRSVLIPQTRKCVMYQCVLKLAPTLSTSSFTPLEFVRIHEVFHASNTAFPFRRGGLMDSLLHPSAVEQRSQWTKRTVWLALLYTTGLTGSLSCFIFADPMGLLPFKKARFVVEVASLLLSSVFCGVFFGFYNRRLLQRLVSTFDFVFLSIKITTVCCCASMSFSWDDRTLTVWSSWIWIHWVLTLDALTPTAAYALGFRRAFTLPIIVLLVVVQVLGVVEIVYWHPERLSGVNLVQMTVAGRQVNVRITPFIVARVWSICLWSCRLLWRTLTRQSEDERLVLQGQVEFHYLWRKRLPSRVTGARAIQMLPRRIHPRPTT